MKTITVVAALAFTCIGFAAQAAPPRPSLTGQVLEVQDVDSYTYLRLKTTDGETWAAVPTSPVKKGAQVTIGNPMVMRNFESKSLKKKFDTIVFGQLGAPASATVPPHSTATKPKAAAVQKVAKATGPDARTVAEVIKGKDALKDKTVRVRAQVVRVSNGILDRNWLHVQDGSGSAADGTHDIVVTTQGVAKVGDVVEVKGMVRVGVDVGAGYRYAVLIEDTALRK